MSGSDEPGFSLPTGTVTFLAAAVTDPPAGDEAVAADAEDLTWCLSALEESIARHGGVRPYLPDEDEGVLGAFSRASDAVAAALDAERAVLQEPAPSGRGVRIRMAVHTGEAQLQDEGAYLGESVAHCVRLRRVAHGGQVLVSASAAALVAGRLPDGAGLVDLGAHRLADLGRADHIWQLTHPELARSFPRLRTLDDFPHNLPVQLTPLIGRDSEVDAICRDLEAERLVTLTGSGGVGKTRLALASAAASAELHPGGVWLVELAGVAGDEGVASATLAALGAHQAPGLALVDLVAMALGGEPSLLVLDNCEHVIDGSASLVAGLLGANGAVTVLATSREPLMVPGEVTWRVPSLDVPPPEYRPSVSTLSQYDAVGLFTDRARRARPSFVVTEHNAAAIAEICHRLDGIPLALELAAACCRQLSAEQIAEDLDNRFRILTGGARTLLPRQRTLAASIDWSHDRLTGTEAAAFRRLGVFAGPFPLGAAEAVVSSAGDLDAVEVFDLLTRLVDKSLVGVDEGPLREPCYRLLESLRAYALDRLGAAGELESTRLAHAGWCQRWLRERRRGLHVDAVSEEVEYLHDDLGAALYWCVDRPAQGLSLLGDLARAWLVSGRPSEAMAAVDRLLTVEHAEASGVEWIAAAISAATLIEVTRGFAESVDLARRAERLATELGRPADAAIAHWLSSYDVESARAACDSSLAQGDTFLYPLSLISWIEMQIDADLSAVSQLDSPDLIAACRESTLLREYADYARAQAARAEGRLRYCIDLSSALVSSRSVMMLAGALSVLSGSALLARDESALAAALEASESRLGGTSPPGRVARHRLALLRGAATEVDPDLRDGSENLSPAGLHLLAREAIDAGDPQTAVSAVRDQGDRGPFSRAILAACEALATADEGRWHDALKIASEHGLLLLVVDALEGLVVAACRSESWAETLRLYGASLRLRRECEYRWLFPQESSSMEDAVSLARQQLGKTDSDLAEAEGTALSWQEAVSYATRARGERRRPRHGWAALTPTEEQVVALVGEGLTNPQIGNRLLMSRATVKTHLEHVFAKLGIHSRAELASRAASRRGPPLGG
jgi:predicted ATPase/DNA-binding CsgD family transcriptional regulator